MDVTEAELSEYAKFDQDGFTLTRSPGAGLDSVDLGRYELPRRSGEAHLYRVGHPLAVWVIEQAKARQLSHTRLVFDYERYGIQVTTLKAYRGQTGWLSVSLLAVAAFGQQEEHLIVSATTAGGVALAEEDPERLLRFPAQQQPSGLFTASDGALAADAETRKQHLLREINQRNLGYFQQEVEKLDAWADDLKSGLENVVKELDREIKDVRRTAAVSATLEEKLNWQKRQRELEEKRGQLRRKIFDRQDEIDAQRNRLIEDLEARLSRRVQITNVFTIAWQLS